MKKIRKILFWILVPLFLVLFFASGFYQNPALRIAEYIVDVLLLILIGIELFGKKKEK
jgi:hypothetical protein